MTPDGVQPALAAGTTTNPSSPIVVEYVFTTEEAIRANTAVGQARTVRFLTAYVVLGGILVWIGLPHGRSGSPDSGASVFSLTAGILFLAAPLWRRFLLGFRIRRQHATLPTANKPVRWTITADSLQAKTAVSESRIEWSAILQARETRDGLVLYTHPGLGQWLPKRGFQSEDDIAQLRALIQQRDINLSGSR